MKRTSMVLAALALFAPAMAYAAPNTAIDEDASEPRLCGRIYKENGVSAAYDKHAVNFLLPVLVRSVSVERGCTFSVLGGRSYSGGPRGGTYTLNTMVAGWYCECE